MRMWYIPGIYIYTSHTHTYTHTHTYRSLVLWPTYVTWIRSRDSPKTSSRDQGATAPTYLRVCVWFCGLFLLNWFPCLFFVELFLLLQGVIGAWCFPVKFLALFGSFPVGKWNSVGVSSPIYLQGWKICAIQWTSTMFDNDQLSIAKCDGYRKEILKCDWHLSTFSGGEVGHRWRHQTSIESYGVY